MKIGFVCLPLAGHLNPMTALAATLKARGHTATLFGVPDAEPAAVAAGIEFVSICSEVYPAGSIARLWDPVRKLHGMDVMRKAGELIHPQFLDNILKALPRAFRENGVDAIVFDTACAFSELAAIEAQLPFVQAWLVLNFDSSGTTPPCTVSWPCVDDEPSRQKNLGAIIETWTAFFVPSVPIVQSHVKRLGLTIDVEQPGALASDLAIVSQTPAEFDFPGIPWPTQFHYTGPFSFGRDGEAIPFAWEKLTGAPLIYASLGTLANGIVEVHRAILEAIGRIEDHQGVLVIGDYVDQSSLGPLPNNVIIVTAAPQSALLDRASLCITNAGHNTVLDALVKGVPLVAIPIGYDNPGVAARIKHHGVGDLVEVEQATGERLFDVCSTVLREQRFRAAARRFAESLAQKDGLSLAADVIEAALTAA